MKKKNQTDENNGKIKTAKEKMDDEGKMEDEKTTQNGTKMNDMKIEDEMWMRRMCRVRERRRMK